MKKLIPIIILFFSVSVFAQKGSEAILIEQFGKAINDDLLARVDNFQTQLSKDESTGYVVLFGDSLTKHRNKRRIEGCNLMRRYPIDSLKFIFEKPQEYFNFEFWKVPEGANSSRFSSTDVDYKLEELAKPVELTNSMATDEFCPIHFDREWYAKFMKANSQFKGKVIIDVGTDRAFNNRVGKYRKELLQKGIASNRIRYFRRHFIHETDEQWWLIPPKK